MIAQILWLIQLFVEAGERKAANQAPPEDYTTAGIIGALLVIGVIVVMVICIARMRGNKMRMARAKRYLLMNVLTTIWGMIHIVSNIADIVVYPEFILFLDILMLGATTVAPAVMLQIADSKREEPDDATLLFIGIGGTAFAVISLLIYSFILQKGYSSFFRLVPELMFRVANGLFGIGVISTAIKLRNSYPIVEPAKPEKKEPIRQPAQENEEDVDDWMKGFDAQTAAATPSGATGRTARIPLREQAYGDTPESANRNGQTSRIRINDDTTGHTARIPRNAQGTSSAAREITREQAALERWQTQRLTRPNEFEEEHWQTQRLERPPIAHPYADGEPVERKSCPDCGKRMPVDFPVCPRCGRQMNRK